MTLTCRLLLNANTYKYTCILLNENSHPLPIVPSSGNKESSKLIQINLLLVPTLNYKTIYG